MFRKFLVIVPVAVLAAGSTACATKKFVRTSVGEVNEKVDSLGRSVEETQERTRQNEAKITDVDQRAQAAAKDARSAAGEASNQATAAASAASAAANTATAAGAKATEATVMAAELDKAARRLVFEVVLSEDQGNFKFAQTALPDEAKARLDQMVSQLKADPKAAWFEIEGHTDNVGSQLINEKLGLERAEAVKRYLYEQHQIPLHKMNVISYGEDKPVAPNQTRDGRAQNRRVVVKVLA
jgi:outer membrane protein OmpA-like peptidoglycan-associated protein